MWNRIYDGHAGRLTARRWLFVLHLEGTKVFEAMLAADFEAWDVFESWTFSFGQEV